MTKSTTKTTNKKSSTSSSKSKLTPLQKTKSALKEIERTLRPHLRLLQRLQHSQNKGDDDANRMQQLAETQTAVSLAIGTLNYIGNRLKGSDGGKKKGDPLRTELDRMRAMLVTLRKLQSSTDAGAGGSEGVKKSEKDKSVASGKDSNTCKKKSDEEKFSPKKKQGEGKSILDVGAAKRMVKAALAGDGTSTADKRSVNKSSKDSSPEGGAKRTKANDCGSTPKKKKKSKRR